MGPWNSNSILDSQAQLNSNLQKTLIAPHTLTGSFQPQVLQLQHNIKNFMETHPIPLTKASKYCRFFMFDNMFVKVQDTYLEKLKGGKRDRNDVIASLSLRHALKMVAVSCPWCPSNFMEYWGAFPTYMDFDAGKPYLSTEGIHSEGCVYSYIGDTAECLNDALDIENDFKRIGQSGRVLYEIGRLSASILILASNPFKFVHGDIHLGNVLWDSRNQHFVLIDYGTVTFCSGFLSQQSELLSSFAQAKHYLDRKMMIEETRDVFIVRRNKSTNMLADVASLAMLTRHVLKLPDPMSDLGIDDMIAGYKMRWEDTTDPSRWIQLGLCCWEIFKRFGQTHKVVECDMTGFLSPQSISDLDAMRTGLVNEVNYIEHDNMQRHLLQSPQWTRQTRHSLQSPGTRQSSQSPQGAWQSPQGAWQSPQSPQRTRLLSSVLFKDGIRARFRRTQQAMKT